MIYDAKLAEGIFRNCGNPKVAKECAFCRTIAFYNSSYLFHIEGGEKGCYMATVCKRHIRLYEIAVRKEYQGQGIGGKMMQRLINTARVMGKEKITFRVYKKGRELEFYKRLGAEIIGSKGEDYEMEIKL